MAKTKMKGVSCTKRNDSVYWYAQLNGQKTYCGLGDKGQELAEAARGKEIARAYENRDMNAGMKTKKAEFKTVLDMSNWYMQLPSTQQQKSYVRKTQACRHLLNYFGKMRVNQVEADDLERYRVFRKGQGAASGTVDLEVAVFSAMYHLAQRRKKIYADAMPGEFLTEDESNPRRLITDDELETLLEHASLDFRDVLICGYESAMRSGEIADLRVNQVHLDVQHISGAVVDYFDLGIFDTKNKTRRTVPVSPRLKKVLQGRIKGLGAEDYVFTNGGYGNYYSELITTQMKAVCKRADVPYGDKLFNDKGERIGIVFHCLRHTRTTKWVEAGYSDEVIRRATGHKSLAAYQKYVHLDPSVVMRLVGEQTETGKSGRQIA